MTDEIINRDALALKLAQINARIDDGIRAARYDGDGSSGGTSSGSHPERIVVGSHRDTCPANTDDDGACTCPPQKPDPVSEKATFDYHELQRLVAGIDTISAAYPSITAGQRVIPGLTPCPKSKCEDCWAAGIVRNAAQKRYQKWCRRCGDHRKRNGYPIPPEAIRALSECDGDWSNWRVQRALRAAS